ncbi:hypothetical protein [Streptomyces sp. NPDC003299]
MITLSSRRPAPRGETWTPEGVTVVERYHNQAHAVVLVYTSAHHYQHNVACLGCHYTHTKAGNQHTLRPWLNLEDAARTANDHAATCRALPRPIPTRPDDDTAREHLRTWMNTSLKTGENNHLDIASLDPLRLTLQRTNNWIETTLQQLAADDPRLARTGRSNVNGGA